MGHLEAIPEDVQMRPACGATSVAAVRLVGLAALDDSLREQNQPSGDAGNPHEG